MRALILSTLSLAMAIACATSVNAQETGAWTGFYAGVNTGLGWGEGTAAVSFDTADPLLDGFVAAARASGMYPTSFAPQLRGGIAGLQAGHDWQIDPQVVLGFEADLQGGSLAGSQTTVTSPPSFPQVSTTVTRGIDWFSTARARIGLLATPDLMVFATAGVALGQTQLGLSTSLVNDACLLNATICADDSSSTINVGWTAGAGVEAKLASNWSIKAEYLYLDLGDQEATITSSTTPIFFDVSSSFATHIVRVGLNYHFD